MNKRHTHRYWAVLKSERWKALRQRLLQKHVGCQRCKAVTTDLEVHHKHTVQRPRSNAAGLSQLIDGFQIGFGQKTFYVLRHNGVKVDTFDALAEAKDEAQMICSEQQS